MAGFSTIGVGGLARFFMRADAIPDVARAHAWSQDAGVPLFILGGGSNIVVSDDGVDGLVLQMACRGTHVIRTNGTTRLTASAGEPWDAFVASTVNQGLAGIECLSGIPGSVGGTPVQNVGAYGQEVAASITAVTAFDRERGVMCTLTAAECGFAYRTSRFKGVDAERFVICDVTFSLAPGPPTVVYPDLQAQLAPAGAAGPGLQEVRDAVLAVRRGKGMVLDPADGDTRSVGSFFTNPIVSATTRERVGSIAGVLPPGFATGAETFKIPAAWLIERAGFERGFTDGPVGISTKHTLAIVNRGGARARDVVRLAAAIKRRVADRFEVALEPEPLFVGFHADADIEYLRRQET